MTVAEDSGACPMAQSRGVSDGDPEVVKALTANVSNGNNPAVAMGDFLEHQGGPHRLRNLRLGR